MKISVRNLEPTKVKLTITVDPEEFNPYLDTARLASVRATCPARLSTSASVSVPLLAKP